ncbi:MAG: tetraacyldisaccharide 4'-kinase [Lewinellaceae bacterium]|nr:tetraacyldisaccharide 4'-kinase [Saprospiraceae bacterium]MCB9344952.1 tetraacyldisaccharide 4'-kinase [Lewinellaceae bacterium]
MPQDIVIRILLLPIALLYGLGVGLRNLLYRIGVLRSVKFDIPVISVGNLTVGGTGKSPHIEYLLSWLSEYLDLAVLSRGYGRSTAGYREVTAFETAETVGDEPLQFKRKFPSIPISVSESRSLGIPQLVKSNPSTHCVLLDDAFQHLAITPGLNIMLTEYNRPFYRDWLLPSGRLREWRNGYRRADIIIVTKCPADLTEQQRQKIRYEIDPYPRQRIYFSRYNYGMPYDMLRPDQKREIDLNTDVLLVSAIANTDYLLNYVGSEAKSVQTIEYEDHHYFSEDELSNMKKHFERLPGKEKIIITTEKDATRLELHNEFFIQHNLPVFILPIEVQFCGDDEIAFQEDVKKVLLDFQA